MSENNETAYLAGGCFWCTEAVFLQIEGVTSVDSGYSGGHVEKPSYEQVCTGTTGHAETVRVTFNTEILSYRDILDIFFATIDPTTLNRQGHDSGTQYRSAIFYISEQQKNVALKVIGEIESSGKYSRPVVTEVTQFANFFSSEDYHKNYFKRNPDAAYCKLVIDPKIKKFRKQNEMILKRN